MTGNGINVVSCPAVARQPGSDSPDETINSLIIENETELSWDCGSDVLCRSRNSLYWQEGEHASGLSFRAEFIEKLAGEIQSRHKDESPVRIFSFGSGGGLSEYYLLRQLRNIEVELILIDPRYVDDSCRNSVTQSLKNEFSSAHISAWVTEQEYFNISKSPVAGLAIVMNIDRPQLREPEFIPEKIIEQAKDYNLTPDDIRKNAICPLGIPVSDEYANALFCLFTYKQHLENLAPVPDALAQGGKALATTSGVLFFRDIDGSVSIRHSRSKPMFEFVKMFTEITRDAKSKNDIHNVWDKMAATSGDDDFIKKYGVLTMPFADYNAGLLYLRHQVFNNSDCLIVAELDQNNFSIQQGVVDKL